MSSHLRLLRGERLPHEDFRPDPFALTVQQQRPGELCETVRPEWARGQLEIASRHAAGAGLPLTLWLTVAVEARRALTKAAELHQLPATVLAKHADTAAALPPADHIVPVLARRLAEYATALRNGEDRFRVENPPPSVVLDVPHTIVAGWALAASSAGTRLEVWVALQALPPSRHLWEAAAAEAGVQLDAWLLGQAISCARSRNTAAHTAA